ncbi:MAG: M1 family metallopeptidase [Flavobacteriaceae bacterium]|jgi:hypothetical protein|nr:M1 family metallopeptidase [Flavobacteriaceae bacterium]
MNKIFLLYLLYSTLGISILKAQLYPYYQQHADYKMDIDVDVKKYQYKGNQTITYKNNSPDTLKVFYFHLYWNAFQPNSMMDQSVQTLGKNADSRQRNPDGTFKIASLKPDEIGRQKISSLKQDGVPVNSTVEETLLKVQLNSPILPNSTTTFEMEWTAQIPVQIRRSGRNNAEGIDLTFTQWYPKAVEYDYEGWHTFDYIAREFHGVFANFDVSINIDKDYIIGAGGVLQNPSEVKGYDPQAKPVVNNGKTKWHFRAENIHDFAWAADSDYTVDSLKVTNETTVFLVYQKSDKTQYWEESKPKIVQYYQLMKDNFGAYPYPAYSFIQGGDGGMEYGMCTVMVGNSDSLQDLCGLMFHEASHSWFQQVLATNESMRAWLDEGFASYAEHLVMAKIFPESVINFPNDHFETVNNYIYFAQSGQEEPMGLLSDHFKTTKGYSAAAYVKGEMFLVGLEYIVGKQNLVKIMKEYFETWKFKHPTDRDFIHIAQKVSQMDLKWYWNYMTTTTRQIDYAIKNVKKSGNNSTSVTLENLGDFPMPVDLYVALKNGSQEVYNIPLNMMHNTKHQEFNLPQKNLPYWKWTQKEYTLEISAPMTEIKFLMIDATQRLGDINYKNNLYPKQK